ncbi:MAG TPA: hypothetical protein PK890_00285 [Terrimesophilobacter sp.]|nr:hypothetical protein [Terrimesophilobacter sp.]
MLVATVRTRDDGKRVPSHDTLVWSWISFTELADSAAITEVRCAGGNNYLLTLSDVISVHQDGKPPIVPHLY